VLICLQFTLSVLPFEASPSVPLHCVEREGQRAKSSRFGKIVSARFPLSTQVERGTGGEASKGRTLRVD